MWYRSTTAEGVAAQSDAARQWSGWKACSFLLLHQQRSPWDLTPFTPLTDTHASPRLRRGLWIIQTSLLSVPSTSANVALASWEDLTESPTRLAALQSSVSKYGVASDNADKQPVNNPEWSLFNMNESLGGSYQRCHMLASATTQAQWGVWVGGGIRKNSSDVSGRCGAQAAASVPLAEWGAEPAAQQLARLHGGPGTSGTVARRSTIPRSGVSATSDWNCGALFFFLAQDDV